MIILITGASHTGKTLLAQRMLEKYRYPYLSIDHLKMGLIRSGQTALTPEDDAELTRYLWPIVREMIKTAIENCQNLIVEGCYIPFDWRRDFDAEYLSSIRFICLSLTDRYIEAHHDEILAHGSDIEERGEDDFWTVESLQAENRNYARGFAGQGETVIRIDEDYEETIRSLLSDPKEEKQTMEIKTCVKNAFSVIGKEGSTEEGAGFIQRLWADANSHFGEVAPLAKKDAEGNLVGVWGAMTDFSRSFQPWDDFYRGLYLAGVECEDDAQAPEGWVKWTVPGYEYLYTEVTGSDTFSEMLAYLKEKGFSLAGAVHDFTDPKSGKYYMFFPIRKL